MIVRLCAIFIIGSLCGCALMHDLEYGKPGLATPAAPKKGSH